MSQDLAQTLSVPAFFLKKVCDRNGADWALVIVPDHFRPDTWLRLVGPRSLSRGSQYDVLPPH